MYFKPVNSTDRLNQSHRYPVPHSEKYTLLPDEPILISNQVYALPIEILYFSKTVHTPCPFPLLSLADFPFLFPFFSLSDNDTPFVLLSLPPIAMVRNEHAG
ncbi:MAG TPA: hypothetical protein PK360_09695 [bacterium]|nr:hypothetical protein [bacterium]